MQLGGAARKGCRMKQPAKNRPCGGMGKKASVRGSAGKLAGTGKAINAGTAYKPKPMKGAKIGRSVGNTMGGTY